jgi:hypothetical protein
VSTCWQNSRGPSTWPPLREGSTSRQLGSGLGPPSNDTIMTDAFKPAILVAGERGDKDILGRLRALSWEVARFLGGQLRPSSAIPQITNMLWLSAHWCAGSSPQPPANEYYFYQSSDGQWLFLHPLLTRILLAHHGTYQALPAWIHGTLVEVEPQMQTPLLRKRHKFLGHLPLGGDPSRKIASDSHFHTAKGS